MSRKKYNLPPLATLTSFEAAARHSSFKEAAQELNVTSGAVSHQVKALEEELSTDLFVRRHRGVSLTVTGQNFFLALKDSFSNIAQHLDQIRHLSENGFVTIAATTAVSALWLTPRLSAFWKHHGDVRVNQLVSDHAHTSQSSIDLQIRYGIFEEEKAAKHALFQDRLIPVCSPRFAQSHPNPSIVDIAAMPLIHLEADDESWTTWDTWFKSLNYDASYNQDIQMNNYMIALQAAQDDVGVVLGWERLINPLIEQGSLVPLGSVKMNAPASFYITSEPNEKLSPNARLLRDWLCQ